MSLPLIADLLTELTALTSTTLATYRDQPALTSLTQTRP